MWWQNNNDRVAALIESNTGIKYSRTIASTYNFDIQNNLFRFNPSIYHLQFDKLMKMGQEFIDLKPDIPQLFYIWGHSYELDCETEYRQKNRRIFQAD